MSSHLFSIRFMRPSLHPIVMSKSSWPPIIPPLFTRPFAFNYRIQLSSGRLRQHLINLPHPALRVGSPRLTLPTIIGCRSVLYSSTINSNFWLGTETSRFRRVGVMDVDVFNMY